MSLVFEAFIDLGIGLEERLEGGGRVGRGDLLLTPVIMFN